MVSSSQDTPCAEACGGKWEAFYAGSVRKLMSQQQLLDRSIFRQHVTNCNHLDGRKHVVKLQTFDRGIEIAPIPQGRDVHLVEPP